MALLLKDKTYLKFETDGTFYIYKNKAARNRIKKATSYKVVLAKYEEILLSFSNGILLYYSPEDRLNVKNWAAELNKYRQDLSTHNITGHYPLMQQYIEDVDNTIPEIIYSARYPKLAADGEYLLKNIYKLVKERNLFGKQEDIKDC